MNDATIHWAEIVPGIRGRQQILRIVPNYRPGYSIRKVNDRRTKKHEHQGMNKLRHIYKGKIKRQKGIEDETSEESAVR